jgi:hypothetical protein
MTATVTRCTCVALLVLSVSVLADECNDFKMKCQTAWKILGFDNNKTGKLFSMPTCTCHWSWSNF